MNYRTFIPLSALLLGACAYGKDCRQTPTATTAEQPAAEEEAPDAIPVQQYDDPIVSSEMNVPMDFTGINAEEIFGTDPLLVVSSDAGKVATADVRPNVVVASAKQHRDPLVPAKAKKRKGDFSSDELTQTAADALNVAPAHFLAIMKQMSQPQRVDTLERIGFDRPTAWRFATQFNQQF